MPFLIRASRRLLLAYIFGFASLITLLVLSNVPAYAEWKAVAESVEGELTVYIDPDTIRRKGDLVKLWELYDHKTVQTARGGPFLSGREQGEYDCAEERRRSHGVTKFSGNMLSGKSPYSTSGESAWIPVAPNTIGQILWTFACSQK